MTVRRPAPSAPSELPEEGAPGAAGAAERILQATARRLVAAGAARLSMQDVAADAGVSKGLIHYHFRDKDALLARAAAWIGEGLVARERAALDGATPKTAVEALWRWVDGELERGHLRALLELTQYDAPPVRAAVTAAARARREAGARTVERLFGVLELRPRVPPALVAGVTVAFVDGLALSAALTPDEPRRVMFDALWLALLSLTE